MALVIRLCHLLSQESLDSNVIPIGLDHGEGEDGNKTLPSTVTGKLGLKCDPNWSGSWRGGRIGYHTSALCLMRVPCLFCGHINRLCLSLDRVCMPLLVSDVL